MRTYQFTYHKIRLPALVVFRVRALVGAVINRTLVVVLNISVDVDVIDGNVVVETVVGMTVVVVVVESVVIVLSMVLGTVIVFVTFVGAIVVVAII